MDDTTVLIKLFGHTENDLRAMEINPSQLSVESKWSRVSKTRERGRVIYTVKLYEVGSSVKLTAVFSLFNRTQIGLGEAAFFPPDRPRTVTRVLGTLITAIGSILLYVYLRRRGISAHRPGSSCKFLVCILAILLFDKLDMIHK